MAANFHFFHQIIFFRFHLKSSFHSRGIQIFVFLPCPLFFPVSQCFRGWLKINIKVYNVINCQNKNLTHFVWYLRKGGTSKLSIDRILNNKHFYWKIIQKICIKISPRSLFLILINNPRHSFKNKIFWNIRNL